MIYNYDISFISVNTIVMSRVALLKGIRDFTVDADGSKEDYSVKLKVDSCAICGSDIRILIMEIKEFHIQR